MNPDLQTVYDAALKLPLDQRRELISRLTAKSFSKKQPGLLRKHFGMIESGDPNSADNARIDAELAEVYADDHSPEN